MDAEVTYCIVNTEQRELLLRCLDAVGRERAALPFETEVLVLDNASGDGSAAPRATHPAVSEVIALELRRGKAENDTALLQRARGRFCLLLNEDSEPRPGATAALHAALTERPAGRRGGSADPRPGGTPQPSAWRFPTPLTALAGALILHRRLTVQSRGEEVREVDWVQSAAMLVRREAAARGGLAGPGVLRLLRRGRLLPAPARRGLGRRSTSRPPRPSTTSSSRPARSPSGGSSSSRATATATCASTTARAPRARCAG